MQHLTLRVSVGCPAQAARHSPASSGNWFFNLALQSSLL
jgi:hypothetical protein